MNPPPHADQSGTIPALTVDAIGKKCPMPIIMLAQRIADVPVGALIEVRADDPASKADVPAWCRLKSHEFLRTAEIGSAADAEPAGATATAWAFLVRRSY